MAPAHPLVMKIGCVQFERLFMFLSFQTLFESDQLTASTKGYSCDKGSGFYIRKRGYMVSHDNFFAKRNDKSIETMDPKLLRWPHLEQLDLIYNTSVVIACHCKTLHNHRKD